MFNPWHPLSKPRSLFRGGIGKAVFDIPAFRAYPYSGKCSKSPSACSPEKFQENSGTVKMLLQKV